MFLYLFSIYQRKSTSSGYHFRHNYLRCPFKVALKGYSIFIKKSDFQKNARFGTVFAWRNICSIFHRNGSWNGFDEWEKLCTGKQRNHFEADIYEKAMNLWRGCWSDCTVLILHEAWCWITKVCIFGRTKEERKKDTRTQSLPKLEITPEN